MDQAAEIKALFPPQIKPAAKQGGVSAYKGVARAGSQNVYFKLTP